MQFAARLKSLAIAALCFLLAWGSRAGTSSSADYQVTNEGLDSGGQRTTSADYSSEGSFSFGNFATSTDYKDRGGYVAGLHNVPIAMTNYTINIYTNSTFKVGAGSVATSPDGDQMIYMLVQNPTAEGGTVANDTSWLFYTPPLNYVGADSFTFTVTDAEGDTASGTIMATITAQPVTSSQPTLNLISLAPTSGSAITLTFGGLPGATYMVQYTGSLLPPMTWTNLGEATVSNGVMTIVDPTGGNATQRYYRTVYQNQ